MEEFLLYDNELCAHRKINNGLTNKIWELYDILAYIHEGRELDDIELIQFKTKCISERLFVAIVKEHTMESANNLCICKHKGVKHFHYIKHIKSGMILVVGSKCIKHFMNKRDVDVITERQKLVIRTHNRRRNTKMKLQRVYDKIIENNREKKNILINRLTQIGYTNNLLKNYMWKNAGNFYNSCKEQFDNKYMLSVNQIVALRKYQIV